MGWGWARLDNRLSLKHLGAVAAEFESRMGPSFALYSKPREQFAFPTRMGSHSTRRSRKGRRVAAAAWVSRRACLMPLLVEVRRICRFAEGDRPCSSFLLLTRRGALSG